MKKLFVIAFLVLLLSNLSLFSLQRMELLKENSQIIFHITDISKCLNAIKQSPMGQLLYSKQMKPFFLGRNIDQVIYKYIGQKQADPKKGKTSDIFLQALKLLKGEFIIGFYKNSRAEDDSFYIIAEMLPADYTSLLQLDNKLRRMENNGEVVRKHQFRNVEILNFIRETRQGKTSNWQAWVKHTLIYGPDRQWLESCIAKIQQNGLPSNSAKAQLRLTLTKHFLTNMIGIGQAAGAKEPPSEQSAIFNAMGIDRFQGLELYVNLLPGLTEIGMKIKAPGMDKGIWQLLGDDPLPIRHQLPYVPANIYSYQVIRLDIAPFWLELPQIFANVNPQLAQQFNMFLAYINNSLQVNLTEDIIKNLDNLVTNYSVLKGNRELEAFAWQIRESRKISMALAKIFSKNSLLYATIQDNLDIQNIKGYTLYSIKPRKGGEQNQAIAMAVVDRNWMIGAKTMIQSYINAVSSRANLSSFYQLPLFNRMMRTVPEKAVGYGLMDFSKGIKTLFSVLELTAANDKPKGAPKMSAQNSPEEKLVDFTKLPPSSFISSFFSPGFNFITKGKDTITIKTTVIYPKKR